MKKFLFSFCIIFLCATFFSQNAKVRVIVATAKCINIDEETKSYLPSIVQQKFESNIGQYMHFLIVDTSNLNEVKRLQQNSEGDSYDEETAIKIGKLANANYAFFPKITKVGKKYFLSVGCTDLTTGLQSANAMSKSFDEVDKLFDGAGSAADAVTLKLCEQLNISLTNKKITELTNDTNVANNTTYTPGGLQQNITSNNTTNKARDAFISKMRQNCKTIYENPVDFRYTFNKNHDGVIIEGLVDTASTSFSVIIPDVIEGVKVIGVAGNTAMAELASDYYNGNIKDNKAYNNKRANLRKKYNIFRYGLKYIAFSDNIENIDEYTISECYTLEEVLLPCNLKEISKGLFDGCNKLKSIELPASIQKIKKDAFRRCESLSSELKTSLAKFGYTQF